MSGGGVGGGTTVAPTYVDPVNGMTFADNNSFAPDGSGATKLNAEIAARQATEKTASDAARQAAIDQNTANETTFQKQLSDATTAATTNANQYFTDNGYDPNMFATQLANTINTDKNSVTDPFANFIAPSPVTTTGANGVTTTATPGTLDYGTSGAGANPTAAFSPNIGQSIISAVSAGDQAKAGNALSSIFSPTYAADNISNDWLAPAASSSLSSQFDPLSAQLTNSLKRGTLNQTGYDAANTLLGTDRTAAQSTINNLGSNILASDRTGINSYITSAKNDAANVNPLTYSSFDPTHYSAGASDLVNQYKGNFAGDLTNAIGKTSFADLGSLLNAGGAVQGANDPTATNPTTGGPGGGTVSDAYIAQQALAKQPRGLGSSGSF